MGNYIEENRSILKERHYIRLANREYTFDFSSKTLKRDYFDKYAEKFCLIVFKSGDGDNAYVMPYRDVKDYFAENLPPDRDRWKGKIRNNIMRLDSSNRVMSVSRYYNNFDLLDSSDEKDLLLAVGSSVLQNVGEIIDRFSLERQIEQFNETYRNVSPYKRRVVSEQVARPGAITDYIKRLCNYTCQICGEQGFMQRNDTPYIEAHHIQELHELLPGSYCSDNIIVVCATCHRKLHYANISYDAGDNGLVIVRIGGVHHSFARNILS